MAEYIKRKAALAICEEEYREQLRILNCAGESVAWNIGYAIKELTAVDAAPVVRCKDCMHYLIVDEFDCGKRYMCKVNRLSYINNDGDMHYCSYGERKEDKAG